MSVAESYNYMFSFTGNFQTIFQSGYIMLYIWVIWFLNIIASFWYCHFFFLAIIHRCIVIFYCNLHFPNDLQCYISFHVFVISMYVLFSELTVHIFCLFSKELICLLLSFEAPSYYKHFKIIFIYFFPVNI